jgi:hypothetical protein
MTIILFIAGSWFERDLVNAPERSRMDATMKSPAATRAYGIKGY